MSNINETFNGEENPEEGPAYLQCCGSCNPHRGEVVLVYIDGWGKFNYCQEAIDEDRRRGLNPIVITETNNEDAN